MRQMLTRDGKKRPNASVLVKHEAFALLNSLTDIDDQTDDNFAEEIERTPLANFNTKYVFNVQSFPKPSTKQNLDEGALESCKQNLRFNQNLLEEPDLPDDLEQFDSKEISPRNSFKEKGEKDTVLPKSSPFGISIKKC